MKFNLQDLNPGAKFFFDEANPAAGSITLRALNMEVLDEIRAKTTKRRVEYGEDGQRQEFIDVDEKLRDDLTWAYVIQGWAGVEDEEGRPIPCTDGNKATLMRGSLVFSGLVNKFLKKLNRDMKKRAEAERKN